MSKLRVCPFCGGEASAKYESFRPFHHNWIVRCEKCGATTRNNFEVVGEAIEAWNKRYEPRTPNGAYVPAGNERLHNGMPQKMHKIMTLEEAIDHCENIDACASCKAEHLQLAEWLKELKGYKEQSIAGNERLKK